jgi:uncharacterized protein with HEPN domain
MNKSWQPYAKHILVADDKKEDFPDIPRKEISGFRNILVHNYLGNIDSITIVAVIEKQLQPLEEVMLALLAESES